MSCETTLFVRGWLDPRRPTPIFCPDSGWEVTPITTWGVPFTALTLPA